MEIVKVLGISEKKKFSIYPPSCVIAQRHTQWDALTYNSQHLKYGPTAQSVMTHQRHWSKPTCCFSAFVVCFDHKPPKFRVLGKQSTFHSSKNFAVTSQTLILTNWKKKGTETPSYLCNSKFKKHFQSVGGGRFGREGCAALAVWPTPGISGWVVGKMAGKGIFASAAAGFGRLCSLVGIHEKRCCPQKDKKLLMCHWQLIDICFAFFVPLFACIN